MSRRAALRQLLLVLQLGECSDLASRWEEGLTGRYKGGGIALGPDLLFFHLAMLPTATPGREVVLGKAGDTAELPCHGSSGKNEGFSWKHSSTLKILEYGRSFPVRGRVAQLPTQGGRHQGLNIPGVRGRLLVNSEIPEGSG